MKLRTRLGAAAGVGILALGLSAAPAAAAETTVNKDFSFVYQGAKVTCTVSAFSRWDYFKDQDRTELVFSIAMIDHDTKCSTTLHGLKAILTYKREGETDALQAIAATLTGKDASGEVDVSGKIVQPSVQNLVGFYCDAQVPPDDCRFSFTTNPK
jgi:hypothetical protein